MDSLCRFEILIPFTGFFIKFEMPLAHLCGHRDVRLYSGAEFKKFAETAGFEVVSFEAQAKMRAHLVARKN